MNLQDLMAKYEEQFGDIFPRAQHRGYTEQELCDIIQKCLRDNKPVAEKNVLY